MYVFAARPRGGTTVDSTVERNVLKTDVAVVIVLNACTPIGPLLLRCEITPQMSFD